MEQEMKELLIILLCSIAISFVGVYILSPYVEQALKAKERSK